MAMSRSFGGTPFIPRPPIAISPALAISSPAMIASSVDLPQPEGPTSTVNSPSSMSRLTFFSTSTGPNRLDTPRTANPAIPTPYRTAPAVRPRMKYLPPNR